MKQPKTRSPPHIVIGAIHSSTIMHVVMRTLLPKKETEAATKKRKTDSGKKRATSEIDRVDATSEDNDTSNKPAAKGTTTAHFIKFINEILT